MEFEYNFTTTYKAVVWICLMSNPDSGASVRTREDIETICEHEGLPFHFFHCETDHDLQQAISRIEQMAQADVGFVLHIDSHACEMKGVKLESANEYVAWPKFLNRLRRVNAACRNNLIVFLQCCFGFHILKHIELKYIAPCALLIGAEKKVFEGDLQDDVPPFYRALLSGCALKECLDEHLNNFELFIAERMFILALCSYFLEQCTATRISERTKLVIEELKRNGMSRRDRRLRIKAIKREFNDRQGVINKFMPKFLRYREFALDYNDIKPRLRSLKANHS